MSDSLALKKKPIIGVFSTVIALVLAVFLGAAPASALTLNTSFERVTMSDGVQISALVVTPPASTTPPPILVAPSSWGVNKLEYSGAAQRFAQAGYLVVSYTSRGFWESGGEADIASPRDVADASEIIDFAIKRGGDAERVGMFGISYGGGISLLTAAKDPRIKAIVPMSSWAYIEKSLYPNKTINNQSWGILLGLGVAARPGPLLRAAQSAFITGDPSAVLPQTPARSPGNYVDAFNANRTATFFVQSWQDSLFEPESLGALYDSLTGPKRMDFVPGDHALSEFPGAVGLPQRVWDDASRWFDTYVAKKPSTGIEDEVPVRLETSNTRDVVSARSFAGATARTETLNLGPQAGGGLLFNRSRGTLGTAAAAPWKMTVLGGVPTTADSGIAMASGGAQGFLGLAQPILLDTVARTAGGIWQSSPASKDRIVVGTPRLTATVSASSAKTSVFGYLYDIGPSGYGELVTYGAATLSGPAGQPQNLDLALRTNAWILKAGHSLALVIDTVDARFRSAANLGSLVSLSSATGSPARLTIPYAG